MEDETNEEKQDERPRRTGQRRIVEGPLKWRELVTAKTRAKALETDRADIKDSRCPLPAEWGPCRQTQASTVAIRDGFVPVPIRDGFVLTRLATDEWRKEPVRACGTCLSLEFRGEWYLATDEARQTLAEWAPASPPSCDQCKLAYGKNGPRCLCVCLTPLCPNRAQIREPCCVECSRALVARQMAKCACGAVRCGSCKNRSTPSSCLLRQWTRLRLTWSLVRTVFGCMWPYIAPTADTRTLVDRLRSRRDTAAALSSLQAHLFQTDPDTKVSLFPHGRQVYSAQDMGRGFNCMDKFECAYYARRQALVMTRGDTPATRPLSIQDKVDLVLRSGWLTSASRAQLQQHSSDTARRAFVASCLLGVDAGSEWQCLPCIDFCSHCHQPLLPHTRSFSCLREGCQRLFCPECAPVFLVPLPADKMAHAEWDCIWCGPPHHFGAAALLNHWVRFPPAPLRHLTATPHLFPIARSLAHRGERDPVLNADLLLSKY